MSISAIGCNTQRHNFFQVYAVLYALYGAVQRIIAVFDLREGNGRLKGARLLPRLEEIDTEALPGPVGVGLANLFLS